MYSLLRPAFLSAFDISMIAGFKCENPKAGFGIRLLQNMEGRGDRKYSLFIYGVNCENIWIISKFNDVLKEFDRLMDEYKISDAYDMLYSFLWSELFDWYFEFTKNIFGDNKESVETKAVLRRIFLESLKLLKYD